MEASKRFNVTLNFNICAFSTRSIKLLGYCISDGEIRPKPDQLQPLKQLPIPENTKSLQRVIGMFACYSQWIRNFSNKIQPLVQAKTFPLSDAAKEAFVKLKEDVMASVVNSIIDSVPFVVETDASDCAIAATLSQAGRPVSFFSRTLNASERKHSSVEKDVYAIVESTRMEALPIWTSFYSDHSPKISGCYV